jgi:hypothetical protein
MKSFVRVGEDTCFASITTVFQYELQSLTISKGWTQYENSFKTNKADWFYT